MRLFRPQILPEGVDIAAEDTEGEIKENKRAESNNEVTGKDKKWFARVSRRPKNAAKLLTGRFVKIMVS